MAFATRIFNFYDLKALIDSDLIVNYDNFKKEDIVKMNKILRKEIKEIQIKRKCDYIETLMSDNEIVYICSNCDFPFEFTAGTPEENDCHYCPKCGNKIINVINLKEEEDE